MIASILLENNIKQGVFFVTVWAKKGVQKFMCKKLKEIHGMQPEDIRRKYDLDGVINMQNLLDKMQIKHQNNNFSVLEDKLFFNGNDSIMGMACAGENDLLILCKDKLPNKVRNYVLAHELGHCCLHLPITSEYHVELKTKNDIYPIMNQLLYKLMFRNKDAKEQEADAFAANLLIPTKGFIDLLKADKTPTICDISKNFCVPEHLVRTKIELINKSCR